MSSQLPSTIVIDSEAIRANLEMLQGRLGATTLMAIVKANAYGHGRSQVAPILYDHGVRRFGVSQMDEALRLRSELPDDAIIFTWLPPADGDWKAAIDAGLQVSASSPQELDRIVAAGSPAVVHLKVDVGMSRAGSPPHEFAALCAHAALLQKQGRISVEAVWSHLSDADSLDPSRTDAHIDTFIESVDVAHAAGLEPRFRHLAATGGTLWHPRSHFDMVRVGIGLYGLSPNPARESAQSLGLSPVLELKAQLSLVKQLSVGAAVSYGGTWQATEPHWVGLLPLGYADGIPRSASNGGPVRVGDHWSRILGRVCMDQCVIDLGTGSRPKASVGDTVTVIGGQGPSAEEWADATGTINYEVVTRLASHLSREVI